LFLKYFMLKHTRIVNKHKQNDDIQLLR